MFVNVIEPTTGLDPEIRRLIWTIINDARKGKTIILTTHSMEEAEALCQRIGIMAKGALRCLGPALRLKELYGSGFKVSPTSLTPALLQQSCRRHTPRFSLYRIITSTGLGQTGRFYHEY
jgi:ABC-type multidrug transport system ATPase subunit